MKILQNLFTNPGKILLMWNSSQITRITTHAKTTFLLVLTLALIACGGLTRSDKPATSTWLLKPYSTGTTAQAGEAITRVAVAVSVSPGLDTDWILTLSADAELNHYTGARWVDNLPELFTSLTARSLTSSGRFDVLSGDSGDGHEDCVLQLEVQAFYADIGVSEKTTGVQLAIAGQYDCESSEPVAIYLGSTVPASAQDIASIVSAFQTATDRVMHDLLTKIP